MGASLLGFILIAGLPAGGWHVVIILSETVPLFPEYHNISSQESKDKTEKKHRLFSAHGEGIQNRLCAEAAA